MASARREFLQLAKTFDAKKSKIGGWYVSEKLDGTRCLWDGGITRGLETAKVPFASVLDPKTGKQKAKIKPRSTGLWSRYGNPIIAPDWFLDSLPPIPLDGELWAGRGNFQLCRSIVGGDTPDPRFDKIQYAVYSTPSIEQLLMSGEIKNTNFHAKFDFEEMANFVGACAEKVQPDFIALSEGSTFDHELLFLNTYLTNERVFLHKQVRLPEDEAQAREQIEVEIEKVLANGGEGLIIRNPNALWTPKRVGDLLKYKPFEDDHGIVVGFTSGRKTDKGSKHLGKIGALILDYKGKRLELSGLTDDEREFSDAKSVMAATDMPGQELPPYVKAKHFKVGQRVEFIFRELTDDGIPKEARYKRVRSESDEDLA